LAREAKALQKAAQHTPTACKKAQRLQAEADSALAEAEALKLQARFEDLHRPARNGLREIATREFEARGLRMDAVFYPAGPCSSFMGSPRRRFGAGSRRGGRRNRSILFKGIC